MSYSVNFELFIKHLESFRYVSVDIFDTLIFRTFDRYQDVFEAVADRYQKVYKEKLLDFPKKRAYAEHKSRKMHQGKEITIKMIYDQLPYKSIIKERLCEIEEACEIENIVPNRCMVDVINWCKEQGKIVILVTDMYLPRHVIEAMMQKVGVSYHYLFISSEESVTKRSGLLFPIVLKKLNISPQQIIHTGDDPNNDIKQPASIGITTIERIQDTILIPKYVKSSTHSISSNHLYNFILRAYQYRKEITPTFRIGYSVIGPLMYEFCEWLHKIKSENKISRLAFIAREGYFIKQCYDKMYGEQSDYIRLNRNMLRLPSLRYGNPINTFIKFLPDSEEFSWKVIFNMIHVDNHANMCERIAKKVDNFSYHKPISSRALKNGRYNDILLILIELQKSEIARQAELLDAYIKKKELLGKRIGLVNNSLNGTIQTLLERYLSAQGKTGDYIGLQFVKNDKCIKRLGNRSRAWITENGISHYKSFLFAEGCILLEHLLFEPIGTSLCFDGEASNPQVVCEKPCMEIENFSFIKEVQNYALQFIEEYRNNFEMNLKMDGFFSWMHLLQNPTKEDAKILCHLYDDEEGKGRFLSDISLPFSLLQILMGKFDNRIMWREGYIKAKQKPSLYIGLYNLRLMLRCYHTMPKYLTEDMKECLSNFLIKGYGQ